MAFTSSDTLIKYDIPIILKSYSSKIKSQQPATPRKRFLSANPLQQRVVSASFPEMRVPTPPPRPKTAVPCPEPTVSRQTMQVLDSILPPKEWKLNGEHWIQHVSSLPGTRSESILLGEELDRRLVIRQAREAGICVVRRELYTQVFDELIRQVTVECAERGLLLLRVRDEIKVTLAAFQTLFESSVAFGMRKSVMTEISTGHLARKISELELDKRNLERQVSQAKVNCEAAEKEYTATLNLEMRKFADELQFLKRKNEQLQTQIRAICPGSSNRKGLKR